MRKLWASTKKEYLLLSRDPGGLLLLFFMPVLLVVTITLIQETTFRTISGTTMDILVVDQDQDEVSVGVKEELKTIDFLNPVYRYRGNTLTEKKASHLVASGDFQLAVVIPEGLSKGLNTKIEQNVEKIIAGFSGKEVEKTDQNLKNNPMKTIKLYFDPATQQSFRNSVQLAVGKMIDRLETQFVYKKFEEKLGETPGIASFREKGLVRFEKINPSLSGEEVLPNSVQHNIPAWTLFAIFFLILPLSLNMIKEKNQGTFVRLQSSPVNYFTLVSGKAILYLLVSILQFLIILGIGVFLFPHLNLPELQLQGNLHLMLVVSLFAGMAAIGLATLIGTVFTTQEQAAPFGAILVILLAAIGGVWVPVFAMPGLMRHLASISPLNWGLEAFYALFLRNGAWGDIAPYLALLFCFFALTMGLAMFFYEKKRSV